jgi:hypothetical protein
VFLFCLAIMFFMRFFSLIDPVAMRFLSRAVLHDVIGVWLSAIILKLLFLRVFKEYCNQSKVFMALMFLEVVVNYLWFNDISAPKLLRLRHIKVCNHHLI